MFPLDPQEIMNCSDEELAELYQHVVQEIDMRWE